MYEAYEEMAVKMMHQIADEAMSRYEIERCYIAHRSGFVAVKQDSILVACSGPHRRQPHEAVMFCVDEVKSKVPIWKKIVPVDINDSVWSTKSEAFWLENH